MSRTYIIAEAGVNHNGSLDLALELVDAAARAGADAVKFQTFKAANIASAGAGKAEYQKRTTDGEENQLAMLKRLELDEAAHLVLMGRCRERGIEFLSTPFDLESLDLLLKLGVSRLKVPSGEITNGPLLLAVGASGLPVILSTGMADPGDIRAALGVLALGMTGGTDPGEAAFGRALASQAGQKALADRVVLLHCTTEYPAPLQDVNLRAMAAMRQEFGLPVGYSDHTQGLAVPTAAAALGACLIEKHFTLDRGLPGPDHKASLEPGELADMVAAVRAVELALGSPAKVPAPSELKNRPIARKSLVAARAIARGQVFTPENLTVKRPGTGISPLRYWEFLGRTAERNYAADEVIR